MPDAWLWPVGLGVLGAVLGSFIATVAVRWPQERSALTGRSACDGCGRTLGALELVPLFSWIALRGRCRTCGARIASSHVATEAIGLAIGVAAGCVVPGWGGAAGAVLGWLLLTAGAIDRVAYRLPNPVTLTIAVLGLTAGAAGLAPPLFDRAIGGLAGFAALWLIALAYRTLRGRDGLGGGDAKLLGAIGLWVGWRALPWIVIAACVIGLGIAVARRLRSDDRLPFGTLLAPAAFAVWLWQGWVTS
jgi:leader peptidase (prepilin peptidase)/N-methyltransferase